jgi:outer membrane protein TolC
VDLASAQAARVRTSRRAQFIGGLGLQRFGDAGGGFSLGPSLRASISLPFTVSGSTSAMNEAAGLAVAEAQMDRTAFASRLRTTLLLARDHYAAALERLQVHDAALLIGAREEREGALGAYRSGELSLIELLDFERALARAETDGLRAAIDARLALAHLFTTAAGLSPTPDDFSDAEAGND